MSMELSRSVGVGLLAASEMKGMISGQSPSSMIIAAISPVVSAMLRRTTLTASFVTACSKDCLTAACVPGVSSLKNFEVIRLRTITAVKDRTASSGQSPRV
eukprot:1035783-Rhodomonas_salina.2